MPDYRRYFVPSGTYFFTIVSHERRRLFAESLNVQRLRTALVEVRAELPFDIRAAVVLPDHMYFIWTLPRGDKDYSKRLGLMKVKVTRSLKGIGNLPDNVSASRRKHRESDVWQRRFWEHTIDDEDEFERFFDYVHYNPVKHRHATCPHLWPYSSFSRWVKKGVYEPHWACRCKDQHAKPLNFSDIEDYTGE